MITAKTWKNGFANGLKTSFLLLKTIIPVFALIKVLEQTDQYTWGIGMAKVENIQHQQTSTIEIKE